MAWHMSRKPSPKFSRRCPVMSTRRRVPSLSRAVSYPRSLSNLAVDVRNSASAFSLDTTMSKASMTVLPVTVIAEESTFSRRRLRRAASVGAKCMVARRPVRRLFISSGHGA